jgi:hypothetical protein
VAAEEGASAEYAEHRKDTDTPRSVRRVLRRHPAAVSTEAPIRPLEQLLEADHCCLRRRGRPWRVGTDSKMTTRTHLQCCSCLTGEPQRPRQQHVVYDDDGGPAEQGKESPRTLMQGLDSSSAAFSGRRGRSTEPRCSSFCASFRHGDGEGRGVKRGAVRRDLWSVHRPAQPFGS